MRKSIPPELETEILKKYGQGATGPEISAWLKRIHSIDAKPRAVQRLVQRIGKERAPIARAVVQEKLSKTLTSDLDAVEQLLADARGVRNQAGKLDDISAELERLAKVDIGQAFNASGQLLSLRDMPEDVRRAISSVELLRERGGIKATETGKAAESGTRAYTDEALKVRFWDKGRGLEMLARIRSNLAERALALQAMEVERKLLELRFKLSGAGGGAGGEDGVVLLPPESD